MMSPASSGGHMPSVVLTMSTTALTGSAIACRTSSAQITMVVGKPLTRSRPRISACGSAGDGQAEPTAILISSAVRSPSRSEYSFLANTMIAWSISSPPTRTDCEVTIPPSEITATSVVPPPTSTTMLPGRLVHRQPGADRGRHRLLDDVHAAGTGLAPGFPHRALLHPSNPAGHRHHQPRPGQAPAAVDLLDEVAQHPLGDIEVGDDTVPQRPDRHNVPRRPADHPFRLDTDRDDVAGIGVECHHRRLIPRDPPAAHIHQRVRGTEVDRQVTAEERQHVPHDQRAF